MWPAAQRLGARPAGEGPNCNASAMLDEDKSEPCIRIVTTPAPECATHFKVRTAAERLANVMPLTSPKCSYRVQHIDRSDFRVAIYRDSPYPKMVPDGYLQIVPA